MAARKCPNCKTGKLERIGTTTSKVSEYVVIRFFCQSCGKQHDITEMPRNRADELLRYEKAYWKMKEVVDKYY